MCVLFLTPKHVKIDDDSLESIDLYMYVFCLAFSFTFSYI